MPEDEMRQAEADRLHRLHDRALSAANEEPTELTPAAIARFEAALIEAHVLRAHVLHSKRHPTLDRYCANLLLRACVELIASNPFWRELKFQVPLVKLSLALNDLERGAVAPLLEPARQR